MREVEIRNFEEVVRYIRRRLIEAEVIDTGEWQAIQRAPQSLMAEIEDISFTIDIPCSIAAWESDIKPNQPWAEDHFQERVSGQPLNPPPSSAWWPFASNNNQRFKAEEKFSHTYPERLWPKYVSDEQIKENGGTVRHGIRFPYGDLADVVKLLKERPGTRQAYIPIWFPEDGAASLLNERVPCTLGYHLMRRHDLLKIVYYIRSCDFLRHFRDDVYMAGRLCQWVADQIDVPPGRLVMHISSMHVFKADINRLRHVVEHEG